MMDLYQLESIITTQIRVRVTKAIGSRFPKISFTNEQTDNTPSFPNVYIHLIGQDEKGNTLENNVIHAVDVTVQVRVQTNTNKADALTVSTECIKALKQMAFTAPLPIYSKDNNIHRCDFRSHRVIAGGDSF